MSPKPEATEASTPERAEIRGSTSLITAFWPRWRSAFLLNFT